MERAVLSLSSRIALLGFLVFLAPLVAAAQGTAISLGSVAVDAGQPVEVSADALSIDQTTGEAVFDGNVLVVQGEVRISAGKVTIVYDKDEDGQPSGIAELVAVGGVTFVTPAEAAEAAEAVYAVKDATVTLTGGVLLTQGQTAISGDRLVIDLESGNGRMEGRVRTVISGGGN